MRYAVEYKTPCRAKVLVVGTKGVMGPLNKLTTSDRFVRLNISMPSQKTPGYKIFTGSTRIFPVIFPLSFQREAGGELYNALRVIFSLGLGFVFLLLSVVVRYQACQRFRGAAFAGEKYGVIFSCLVFLALLDFFR